MLSKYDTGKKRHGSSKHSHIADAGQLKHRMCFRISRSCWVQICGHVLFHFHKLSPPSLKARSNWSVCQSNYNILKSGIAGVKKSGRIYFLFLYINTQIPVHTALYFCSLAFYSSLDKKNAWGFLGFYFFWHVPVFFCVYSLFFFLLTLFHFSAFCSVPFHISFSALIMLITNFLLVLLPPCLCIYLLILQPHQFQV